MPSPVFQHRHYKALAKIIADMKRYDGASIDHNLLRERIADAMARDNPRFDHGRFFDACAGETSNGRNK